MQGHLEAQVQDHQTKTQSVRVCASIRRWNRFRVFVFAQIYSGIKRACDNALENEMPASI